MKKLFFLPLIAVGLLFTAAKPIEVVEPQFSGVDCGRYAITIYDELVNGEVDRQTALNFAVSAYNDCLEQQ